MSKYTIIEKSGQGNNGGSIYTITYQVQSKGYDFYKTKLYCLGILEGEERVKYCFLSDVETPYIDTDDDRTEFLEELYKYQLGGSYRKTHPILKSTLMELQDKEKQLNEQLREIQHQIDIESNKEADRKYQEYRNSIDEKSVNEYAYSIINAITSNDRYTIREISSNFFTGMRLLIYDKQLHKNVKMITINKEQIELSYLDKLEVT